VSAALYPLYIHTRWHRAIDTFSICVGFAAMNHDPRLYLRGHAALDDHRDLLQISFDCAEVSEVLSVKCILIETQGNGVVRGIFLGVVDCQRGHRLLIARRLQDA
jgi:hypothetical protein